MARTTLRDYLREIEGLIEGGNIDEGIAHCRYILQLFPKHIATYRLLGKAYLEAQRYGDAADVLQRVLSCIPDDFIAHLGMSIIREDEGNLDAAIWHMERAFEVQPANAAIQEELRRLFGRRDGLEPPKVHLTRGALARMYAKGDLYQQAIAELRAALAEDPQRPDLQVLLARMYANAGQRLEAAETCSALLSKLPYCMEANRILADILTGTERSHEAETYRQRVADLDPYAAHLSPSAASPDQVPASAVSFERYEYTPGQTFAGAKQPDWAASLGVEVEGLASQAEELPEWLASPSQPGTGEELSQEIASPPGESPEAAPVEPEAMASPNEEIPEWLRSAGWETSEGDAEQPLPGLDLGKGEDLPEEELASAEIPEWLRGLAPQDAETVESPLGELDEESEPPDWLAEDQPAGIPEETGLDASGAFSEIESMEGESEAQPEAEQEIPDWLRELSGTGPALSGEEAIEPEEGGLPEQSGMGEEAEIGEAASEEALYPEQEPEASAEVPDWLRDLEKAPADETEAPAEREGFLDSQEVAGEESRGTPEMPAWMSQLEEPSEIEDPGLEAESETEDLEAGEIPDWLRELEQSSATSMDEAAGAEEGEEAAQPEATEGEIPEWLRDLEAPAGGEAEGASLELGEETGLPERTEESDFPAWLREMEEEPLASQTPEIEPLEEGSGEAAALAGAAAWLASEDSGDEPQADEAEAAAWSYVPSESAPEIESPEPESGQGEAEEEVPDWLRAALDEETEAVETGPEAEIPDWLSASLPEEPPLYLGDTKPVRVHPEPVEEIEEPAGEEQAAEEFQPEGAQEPQEMVEAEEFLPEAAEAPQEMEELEEFQSAIREELPEAIEADTEAVPGLLSEEEAEGDFDLEEPALERPAQEAEATPVLNLEEEDAAMAWLESLAARQGALEEELLTSPEERTETPPEWVQQIAVQQIAEEETGAVSSAEIEEGEPEMPEWLREAEPESLPADEALPEEVAFHEPGAGEMETELPEWLRETQEYAESAPEEGLAEFVGETTPGSEAFLEEETGLETLVPEEPAGSEIDAVPLTTSEEEPISEQTEVPEWLREFAESELEAEEPVWTPAGEPEFELAEPLDLNTASLTQLEQLPGVGYVLAQNILEFREAHGPFTSLETLQEVPGVSSEQLDSLRKWLRVAAPVATSPEQPTPDVSASPELSQAWSTLVAGDVANAMEQYDRLIRKEHDLDRLIHDLREATFLYPLDVSVHQALGDAYLRSNRLQEALEAYQKAEDLIQ